MQEVIEGFQLSPQQEHLWLLQHDHNAYRAHCGIALEGPLDIHALQCAIEAVIEQNEIYRTCFRRLTGAKTPLQMVAEKGLFTWQEIDLCHAQEQARELKKLAEQEKLRPIDCEQGPLCHCSLVALSSHKHLLLVHTLALYADRRTLELFMHKVARFYCQAYIGDDVADDVVQYIQFSEWQNSLLEEEVGKRGRELWRKKDLVTLATSSLPGERKVSETVSFSPAMVILPLEHALQEKLYELVEQHQTSTDLFLLACWNILLWRLTGQKSLCIGLGVDERVYEELAETAGPLTKYVPLSCYLDEKQSFATLLRQIGNTTEEAFEWQQSFLWQDVVHADETAMAPFFPMSYDFNKLHISCLSNHVLFELQSVYSYQEPFKVNVSVMQREHDLIVEFHYDANIFCPDDIERLAEQFQTLVENAVARPEAAIETLDILSQRAQQRILVQFNATRADVPLDTPMHLLFEEQVWRTPDNTAVIDGEQRLSYIELNQRANQLAHYLQELGVGPDVLVGISMERSADLLVGILGILKAGGAYVPLDHTYPVERLAFIIADTQMPVLLTQQRFVDHFSKIVHAIPIDKSWPIIAQHSGKAAPSSGIIPATIAYVIYTSGSTGTPKGVMISHQGLVNYLTWCTAYYRVAEGCGSVVHSSIAFDLTITALFSPLLVGKSVFMVGEDQGIEALGRALREGNDFSLVKLTPAHLGMLNTYIPANELANKIRTMVIGGEALLGGNLIPWRMHAPDTRLINEYGPTEAVVGCCIHEVSAGQKICESVPIGRPIANTQLYILDAALQPLPIGVPGEIYIGGSGLARGYLNRPELTAERFIPNPFTGFTASADDGSPAPSSCQPGARLYKTGDLARYCPDGTIEYLGRRDYQVKIRGYRIELEEIEAVLLLHPHVRECVVVAREDVPGNKQLVAYVGTEQRTKSLTKELRDYLREKLPEYMLPSLFVVLDVLPLTPNGKVDRQALPVPEGVRHAQGENMLTPRTPIEEMVAAIWKKILRLEQIGMHENFFDIGGHSLLATQIASRLRSEFLIDITVNSIFEVPTVAGLANRVEEALRSGSGLQMLPIVPVSHQQPLSLSFAQQRLWFLDRLIPNSSFYNVANAARLSGTLNIEALERSIKEVVRRHASLRTTFQMSEGQPVQVINAVPVFHPALADLSALSHELREAEIKRLAEQEAERPFDLAHGPLLRTIFLRLQQDEHVILYTTHHIISDGWSSGLLIQEVTTLYSAFVEGKPSPLPELPIQYADFAVWQRQWLQGDVFDTQMHYWTKQLGKLVLLDLPTDRPRSRRQTFRGSHLDIALAPQLSQDLKALSEQEGVTLFMTLLAAFQILLACYSGQDDIVVGTDVANRNRAEIEDLIGFFVNQLVLRTDLSGNPTFRDLLRRVRTITLQAYAHQDLPFEKLVEVLNPRRSTQVSPFFQVKLVWQNTAIEPQTLPGITVRPLGEDAKSSAKLDLVLFMGESVEGLQGSFVYNTDLFDATTMSVYAHHLRLVLENVTTRPDIKLDELKTIIKKEQEQRKMEARVKKENSFLKLKAIKPKVVSLSSENLVQVDYLEEGSTLPLVIRPRNEGLDLIEWTKNNVPFLETELLKHGVLLFRGFNISSPSAFESFASTICPQLFSENSEHPREEVSENVYTPVFYPPEKKLLWHNENSFNASWPVKIWFCCGKPADQGGETPVVDSRKVFQTIDPAIREQFMRKNVMYVRNYGDGLGLHWSTVFRTKDKAEVEAYCRKEAIELEWKDGDRLRTRQIRPAVLKHPKTGEYLWWNQATHWHPACLEPEVRASLSQLFAEEDLPRNCYYGDGSPIEDEAMHAICNVYQQLEVSFPWQLGDIMMLDNMLAAHARNPFQGKRKIYVALGEMISLDDVQQY